MFKFSQLVILGFVFCSLACQTAEPVQTNQRGPRKQMLQYNDPIRLVDLWENWTPSDTTQVPKFFRDATPFEEWQVDDVKEMEKVWSVLSTVLSGLRSENEDEQVQLAIGSTLTLLEPIRGPNGNDATLDFTFMTSSFSVAPIDRWEGMVIRWSKTTPSGSPMITLFISRKANSKSSTFDRVYIWIESGFLEVPIQGFEMLKSKSWGYQRSPNLIVDPTKSGKKNAQLYAETLSATLWKDYTSKNYVTFDKKKAGVSPEAFGKVQLRDIELVFDRTQFPPKFSF